MPPQFLFMAVNKQRQDPLLDSVLVCVTILESYVTILESYVSQGQGFDLEEMQRSVWKL